MVYESEEYKLVNGEMTLDMISDKVSKHCEFIYNTLDDIFKKDKIVKSHLNYIKIRDYSVEDYDIFMKIFDRINNLDKEDINKSYIKTYTVEYLKHLLDRKQHDKTKQTKSDNTDYFIMKRFTEEENDLINSIWNTKELSDKIDFVKTVSKIIRKYIDCYIFKDERLYNIVKTSHGKYVKTPQYHQKVKLLKILLRKMYERDEEVGYEG